MQVSMHRISFQRNFKFTILPLFALLGVCAAQAVQAAQFNIDPAHSSVGFQIRHLVSKVNGHFDQFSGEFSFDGKDLKTWKGQMTIQTASINTGNAKRDAHLKTADFFDVQKFPTMTFTSGEVSDVTPTSAKVHGTMTMHGVSKDIVLNLELGGVAKGPDGKNRAGITASGKLNRSDFGIKWNKALDAGGMILGDEVTLQIELEAIQQ